MQDDKGRYYFQCSRDYEELSSGNQDESVHYARLVFRSIHGRSLKWPRIKSKDRVDPFSYSTFRSIVEFLEASKDEEEDSDQTNTDQK
ncbi:hypothetical protein [Dubosiella newyorkensis]|uniref:hypothetical protein n=1 Tax=Dubosiella newyorkensis TaxID=1862672 RepID=UPI003F67E63E